MASITIKNIPPELHARIKQVASDNRRSINNELIVALEQLFLAGGREAPVAANANDMSSTLALSSEQPTDASTPIASSDTDTIDEASAKPASWLLSTPPMTSTYRVKPRKS